jgi:hypothetical protein
VVTIGGNYNRETENLFRPFYVRRESKFDMLTHEKLREIEHAFAFRFPQSFVCSVNDAIAIVGSKRFCDRFPGATLLSSVPEITTARESIPECLQPFMRVSECQWPDIYAFDLESVGPEFKVVVWSDHAIVREWDDFRTFWLWVQEVTGDPKSDIDMIAVNQFIATKHASGVHTIAIVKEVREKFSVGLGVAKDFVESHPELWREVKAKQPLLDTIERVLFDEDSTEATQNSSFPNKAVNPGGGSGVN